LINLLAKDIAATEICRSFRTNEDLQPIRIIAIANRLNGSEASALLQKGFDGYVANSEDAGEVIDEIEKATAIIY